MAARSVISRPAGFPCACKGNVWVSHDTPTLECMACGKTVEGVELLKLDLAKPKKQTFDADAHRDFMRGLG